MVKIGKTWHTVTSKFPVSCVNRYVVCTAYDVLNCLKRNLNHKLTGDTELPVHIIFVINNIFCNMKYVKPFFYAPVADKETRNTPISFFDQVNMAATININNCLLFVFVNHFEF